MKEKIITISRWIFGVFAVCLAVVIFLAVNTKEEVIDLGIIGIPFLLSSVLTVICLLGLFIRAMAEKWKQQGIMAFVFFTGMNGEIGNIWGTVVSQVVINLKEVSLAEALKSPLFLSLQRDGTLLEEHTGGCVLFEQEEKVKKILQNGNEG